MDTETLQQLITMLGDAGEGAFTLALLFVLKGYFSGLLTATGVFGIAYLGYKTIMSIQEDRALLDRISRTLGYGDYQGYYREKENILKQVEKLMEMKGRR